VHARLLLDALAASESLSVSPEETEERIRREAARTGKDAREIRKSLAQGDGMEALKIQMLREKSLDFLTSVANIHREG
jgi:FKBP-type peptidyl-prolyl cis-trans isomerase (trigger factor)